MIRVLVISDVFPFPTLAGDSIRTFEFIKALSEMAQTHLVAAVPRSYSHLRDTAQLYLDELCSSVFLFDPGDCDFDLEPWFSVYRRPILRKHFLDLYRRKDVTNAIQDVLLKITPDVVWIDKTFSGHYLQSFDTATVRVVINTHNVESRLLYECAPRMNPKERLWNYLMLIVRQYYERYWFSKADRVIAVSEDDANYYCKFLGPDKVTVIPNFIDLKYYRPANRASAICLTGSMDYLPNIDGTLYFYNQIWPMIKTQLPEVKLLIAGKNPPEEIQSLSDDRVIVTGYVSSMIPYFEQSGAAVVPLRFGGGTRLKILEAMASQVPVVSTSLGCKGLDAEDNVHLLVADDPKDFAEHVLRIFRDKSLAEKIAQNARKLVIEKYSRAANFEQIGELLLGLATH